MKMKNWFAALLLGIVTSNAAYGGFDEGLKAYRAGDYLEAQRQWRPLANQNDARAQFYLGLLYDFGEGAPNDDKLAVEWYRKAADQGNAAAQYNLTANSGNSQARGERDKVAERLTRKQLAEAQQLAAAWKPGELIAEVKYVSDSSGSTRPKPSSTPDAKPTGDGTKATPVVANSSSSLPAGKACSPPAGRAVHSRTSCNNGDCIREFDNGCRVRFQAHYCFDAFAGAWEWKPDGC